MIRDAYLLPLKSPGPVIKRVSPPPCLSIPRLLLLFDTLLLISSLRACQHDVDYRGDGFSTICHVPSSTRRPAIVSRDAVWPGNVKPWIRYGPMLLGVFVNMILYGVRMIASQDHRRDWRLLDSGSPGTSASMLMPSSTHLDPHCARLTRTTGYIRGTISPLHLCYRTMA